MAEREVEVVSASPAQLRLRLLGSACDGCLGGCAGRCSVFASVQGEEFQMAPPPGPLPALGAHLRLRIDDPALRRLAWRGYGLAWLGLVLGAVAGRALAVFWPAHADVSTLCGLLAGTFLAVLSSKRPLPEAKLLASASHPLQKLPE